MISLKGKSYTEVKILEVSDSKDFTFDVEVKERHHYLLGNGIISHNTGAYANNVSGGLEPLFGTEYTRTMIVAVRPEGLLHLDKSSIDWADQNKKYRAYNLGSISQENWMYWEWVKEGDENLLRVKYNDVTYKIDRGRGLTKEVDCVDWAVRKLKAEGNWNPKAEWAATAYDLTVEDHVSVMKIFAKYVDSAISKTVNIPNDYPYEKFKAAYMDVWKTGYIKGFTTYRDGTMANVLKNKEEKPGVASIPKNTAPKRLEKMPAKAYTLIVKGQAFYVVVGLLGEDPFEVFTGMNLTKDGELYIPKWAKDGIIVKKGSRDYSFVVKKDDVETEYPLTNGHADTNADALTRMISLGLRHGSSVTYVVQQLEKTSGDMTSFAKALGRALKKHIPEGYSGGDTCGGCGSKNVERKEGCKTCKDCGWSAC